MIAPRALPRDSTKGSLTPSLPVNQTPVKNLPKRKNASVLLSPPSAGGSWDMINKPDVKFGQTVANPAAKQKDYRAPFFTPTSGNTDSANMAMSCRVINEFHYGSPSINPMNALQVQQGYARGQAKGLDYLPRHPVNNPVLYMPSNFYPWLANPLTSGGGHRRY